MNHCDINPRSSSPLRSVSNTLGYSYGALLGRTTLRPSVDKREVCPRTSHRHTASVAQQDTRRRLYECL